MGKRRGRDFKFTVHLYREYSHDSWMTDGVWAVSYSIGIEIPLASPGCSSNFRKSFGKIYTELTGKTLNSSTTRAVFYMKELTHGSTSYIRRTKFSSRKASEIIRSITTEYIVNDKRYPRPEMELLNQSQSLPECKFSEKKYSNGKSDSVRTYVQCHDFPQQEGEVVDRFIKNIIMKSKEL